MENTKKVLEVIRKALNENEQVKEVMNELRKKAIENNWTKEQWEQMKYDLFISVFYKFALEDKNIMNGLVEDIYNECRA